MIQPIGSGSRRRSTLIFPTPVSPLISPRLSLPVTRTFSMALAVGGLVKRLMSMVR